MEFGPWLPDLPPLNHEGLVVARNVYPSPKGYRPVQAQTSVTEALEGINGGAAFVASEGTTILLGGKDDGLYAYAAGWSSIEGATAPWLWGFAQFGDAAIAVYGGAPIDVDIIAGTAAPLGGSPPDASLVATVRDFVWLAGDPNDRQTLSISGYNNRAQWTPGTNQATVQSFPDGGPINGLASGEYGLILQRSSIKRGSYLGDGTVNWQFDEISSNIGCIAKGSVAQAGRLVFFLSERGFMLCDGNDVKPIGNERVDATFFQAHSRTELDSMTAAIDPRRYVVAWAIPGDPGRLWIYNWALDRWSDAALPIRVLFSAFTANITLEEIDTLYPDGIDSVPYSLDSSVFSGGNPLLLVADKDGAVGPLSGTNLQVRIVTPSSEWTPGRVTKVRTARPLSDADTMTLSLNCRMRLSDAGLTVSSSDIRNSGHIPIRASGRYFDVTLVVDDPVWTYAQGLEFEATGAEAR